MGNMTRDSMDTYLQTYAGAKLRSFDKTITTTTTAYIRVYGTDSVSGAVIRAQNGPTSTQANTHRFEYTNAPNSLYDNYIDNAVFVGSLAYSQSVVDNLEAAVGRTVALIVGRLTNRSYSALLCHNSCHASCHTSRGRR